MPLHRRAFESDFVYAGRCTFHGNSNEVCCDAWQPYAVDDGCDLLDDDDDDNGAPGDDCPF